MLRPPRSKCRRWARVPVIVAALFLGGCGAGATSSAPPAPPGAQPATSSSAQPATTPPPTSGGTVRLGDSDSGRTVTVSRGTQIVVTLGSTYWTIAPSSNGRAVSGESTPAYSPQMSGCVPGQGCGTVTAQFQAVGDGSADLSASRTSCGEALRCTGSAGSWRVTVVVTG
jgi:hypothetical protein